MRRPDPKPWWSPIGIGACVLSAGLLSGCTDSPPTVPQIQPSAGPEPAAVPQPAAAQPRRKTEPKTAKAPQPTIDPNASPADVFAITGVGTEFDVIGPEPVVSETDLFLAEFPSPGLDSTRFTVAASPRSGSPPGQPRADFQLPEGFRALPEFGYSDAGLPLRIVCEADQAVMALVSAGVTQQGSDMGPPETRPQFSVYLDPFYIDVTEVTVGQYESFRDSQREKKRSLVPPLNEHDLQSHPVLGVSWGGAQAYARWAGKELPTEAEWEKAARGPKSFRTPWGDGRAVWPRPRRTDQIDPVGSFLGDRSPYGVLDLAGNAKEWVADFYSPEAYREMTTSARETVRNPQGPRKSTPPNHRVVKGNGPDWAAYHREGRSMSDRYADVGFRCVLRVKLPEAAAGSSP